MAVPIQSHCRRKLTALGRWEIDDNAKGECKLDSAPRKDANVQSSQLRFAAALIFVLMVGSTDLRAVSAADSPSLEQQVKSAFVVNFIQFVDWPAAAFDTPDAPVILGVADEGELGAALAAATNGKSVRGRKILIRHVTDSDLGRCHVLVIGTIEGTDLTKLLQAAAAASTLTIGESSHFTEAGGMINFYLEDRKIRFEINLAAGQRAQLQFSSKLLKLARVVNK